MKQFNMVQVEKINSLKYLLATFLVKNAFLDSVLTAFSVLLVLFCFI